MFRSEYWRQNAAAGMFVIVTLTKLLQRLFECMFSAAELVASRAVPSTQSYSRARVQKLELYFRTRVPKNLNTK